MVAYNRYEIQRMAIKSGPHMSWLQFINSMAAAKRIARDVESYIQEHGIDLKARGSGTVVAVADEKWTGTWTVQVHIPGFTGVPQRSAAKREEETELAVTALRASVNPSDLVRSWRS